MHMPRRTGRKSAFTAVTLSALFATTACVSLGSTSTTTTSTSTTTTPWEVYPDGTACRTEADGSRGCVTPGRPLRRRRRRGALLPVGGDSRDVDARSEYASVASFGELALRLIAVGAPVELVEACHRAALDEIRHARQVDALARRSRPRFGPIPELLGRRIGGAARSRRAQLRRIAVESFTDGWRNESAAATVLEHQAAAATHDDERATLLAMAADERGHAELARRIVTWCFDEEPVAVGSALATLVR